MRPEDQQSSQYQKTPQEPTTLQPEQLSQQPPVYVQPDSMHQQSQYPTAGLSQQEQRSEPQPQYTTAVPAARHTDVLGIWSIVLAFIAPLVGLILGIVGISKAKKRQSSKRLSIIGTILNAVSLLVVAPLIILIVMLSAPSLQQNTRDSERQTDILVIQRQLEAYWVDAGAYPTIDQLNDEAWRTDNLPGLTEDALIDPQSTSAKLVSSPQGGYYAYIAMGCKSTGCTSFRIVATPEDRVSADPDKFEVASYEQ